MSLTVTEAIVLHAFDYLESSRIIRLLTRVGGVQSVLARGARKSRGRYGSSLDLFAEGTAEIYIKPNRELQNLSSFDVARSRSELAHDIGRFTAASTVAELALRFAGEDSGPLLYDTVAEVLDRMVSPRVGESYPCSALLRSCRAALSATLHCAMRTKQHSRTGRAE